MGQVGDRLRLAREARGLTLEQVEDLTKIRRRYLQALEEEDYDQLPGEVFTRGFVRNYAQAVGLDPDEILAIGGWKAAQPIAAPLHETREPLLDEPLTEDPARQWMTALLIGLMVIIVVGLGVWTFWHYLGPSSTPPRATAGLGQTPVAGDPSRLGPTSTPSATVTAQFTATPTATSRPSRTATAPVNRVTETTPITGVSLRLQAVKAAWVRVIVDGQVAYEATMRPGEMFEWRGNQEILLRVGNAGGVRLWYNGEEQQPLGGAGEVVERAWRAGFLPPGTAETPEASPATPGPLGIPPSPIPPP